MKRKNRFTKLIALILPILIIGVIIAPPKASALNAQNSVSVTIVTQSKSNWCWAACAEMIGKYYKPSWNFRNQSSIVKYVKGSTINQSGSLYESAKGTKYCAYNKKSFSYIGVSQYTGIWTWDRIRTEVDNGNPLQACAGYYNNGQRNGGHIVVIYGWLLNNSNDTYYIRYIDPWDGTQKLCLYSQFVNGSFNQRQYDGTVFVL